MSLAMVYGEHLISKSSHEAVRRIHDFANTTTRAAAPATAPIVEAIPLLNYLPEWLAPWKRYGMEKQRVFSAMFQELLDDVQVKMVRPVLMAINPALIKSAARRSSSDILGYFHLTEA